MAKTEYGQRFDQNNPQEAKSSEYQGTDDFRLKSLKITSPNGGFFDIRNIFVSLNMYEDLFSNCMSADLTLIDSGNIKKFLPIIGQEEKVEIEYETPGADSIKLEFFTYGLPQRVVNNTGRKQLYTMKLVSEETYMDLQTKFSRSYKGSVTDIIKKIYDEKLKISKDLTIDVDSEPQDKRYIIPYWSPLQAINWLTQRAIPADNPEACNYVFYETVDAEQGKQKFMFTTIEKLLKDQTKPVMDYLYRPTKQRDKPDDTRVTAIDYRNIYEIKFLEEGDRLDEIAGGRYASTLLVHDIITQKFAGREEDGLAWEDGGPAYSFKLKDEFDKVEHVEKEYPLSRENDKFSDTPLANFTYRPKHYQMFDDIDNNDESEKWILKRKSFMKGLGMKKILMQVAGDSRLSVGDVIFLDLAAIQATVNGEDDLDKYESGRYLITELNQSLSYDGHLMYLKVVRDSTGEPIADRSSDYRKDRQGGGGYSA
tara:strand:- start:413 stop:1855 length:1443 start_codon:yes stop_codon:yes gene_type:complete